MATEQPRGQRFASRFTGETSLMPKSTSRKALRAHLLGRRCARLLVSWEGLEAIDAPSTRRISSFVLSVQCKWLPVNTLSSDKCMASALQMQETKFTMKPQTLIVSELKQSKAKIPKAFGDGNTTYKAQSGEFARTECFVRGSRREDVAGGGDAVWVSSPVPQLKFHQSNHTTAMKTAQIVTVPSRAEPCSHMSRFSKSFFHSQRPQQQTRAYVPELQKHSFLDRNIVPSASLQL